MRQGQGDLGSGEEEGLDTSDAIKVQYRGDSTFEILVEPDPAKEARFDGKDIDITRLLFVQEVFKNADTGEKASPDELEREFGTRQVMEAARKIFEEGDMQLTTEQKEEMRREKHDQVVSMIARRAQNPKTGNPHPPQRVENALEEAGFDFEALRDAEEQFKDAVEAIRPIIPVSLDEKTVAVKVPADYGGQAYNMVQQRAEVLDEEWGSDFMFVKIRVPAGILSELMDELQELSSGEAEVTEA